MSDIDGPGGGPPPPSGPPPPPSGPPPPPPPAGPPPAGGPGWAGGTGAAGVPGASQPRSTWTAAHGDDGPPAPFGGQVLPLRPMSVSDLLDGCFRGLRATFGPVVILVLVLVAPVSVLTNLALTRLAPGTLSSPFGMAFDDQPPAPEEFGDPFALIGVTTLAGLVTYVVGLLISAAVLVLVLDVDRGREADLGAAVRGALQVFATTLGASLLLVAGGIAAFFAFMLATVVLVFIPVLGIILVVLVLLPLGLGLMVVFFATTSLVVPVAVAERGGVIHTLGRVWWVLRRRFWRVIGVTVLVGLLVLAVTGGLQFGTTILAMLLPAGAWVVTSVGEVISQLVSIPVTAFAALLIYLDARVRLEGLDVQLRARGVTGP